MLVEDAARPAVREQVGNAVQDFVQLSGGFAPLGTIGSTTIRAPRGNVREQPACA